MNNQPSEHRTSLPDSKFIKHYQRGEVIFSQGQLGTEMFIVVSGRVTIEREVREGRRVVADMVSGDIFGELAIIDSGERTATATVEQDDTQLVCIDQARFVYLVSQQPAFALTVMRVMAERIQQMNLIIDSHKSST